MVKKIAIVNGQCYQRRKNACLEAVIDGLKKNLGATVVFTEHPGHAMEIARDSYGYELIIGMGGDGTMSEIVNGMNLEGQAVAVIPLGAGNSLARDLGIISPIQAVDIIKKYRLFKADLIGCEFKMKDSRLRRYGVATSGLGFISDAACIASRYLKRTGPFCYPLAACFSLFNQKPISARVGIDKSPAQKMEFTVFIINNTEHVGNLCIFPRAKLDDSKLDLFLAKTSALTQSLANLGVITRTYFYNPGVIKKIDRLDLFLDEPSSLMLDGEVYGPVDEVTYSVLPRRLKLLS